MKKGKQKSARNSWATPQQVFDEANNKYGPFEIDVAASKSNTKCRQFFDGKVFGSGLVYEWVVLNRAKDDTEAYLKGEFTGYRPAKCWMNPPYSNPYPWMKKASEEAKKGCTVVALVNADHTTQWYKDFVYDYANKKCHPNVERVDWPKRIKFVAPKGLKSKKTGKPVKSTTNPFPSMLVIFRPPTKGSI